MGFWKRLRYYLIGVGIGSIMVWFMLGQRENKIQCTYFPNDRVLNDLSKKELSFSDLAQCQFNCLKGDSVALHMLLQDGDVDFENSLTEMDTCRVYHISADYKNYTISGIFETCDSTAKLKAFILPTVTTCSCN